MKTFIKKNKENIKDIAMCGAVLILVIGFLGLFLFCVDFITPPWFYTDNTIAYETVSAEYRTEIKVEKVIKEKGKEDIYRLSFSGVHLPDYIEIPASTYEQYIGENNNAISYKYEEISLYVADCFFGTSFDHSKIYYVSRCALPWENQDITFSEDNIEEFKNLLIKDKDLFDSRDLSFEFDSAGNGTSNTNCLDRGAQRFSKKA